MITAETKATVQDSCERWFLCYEYIERWSPGFFQRMAVRDAMRKEMRTAAREINYGND